MPDPPCLTPFYFSDFVAAMSCTHESITRDGHTLDVLTDEKNGLRIAVTRLGAELVSLVRRNTAGEWIGFLYRDGDLTTAKTGWNNHATVMGYFVHRLKDGQSDYRGQEIRGGTHSFLRHTVFDAPEAGPDSLTYRIDPARIAPEAYPLKVALALTYALDGNALRVTFHFKNREPDTAAHVSFGLHPGFAAGSLESAELMMPPGIYVRHFAPGNFLSGETEEIDFAGGPMPFPKAELPGSFLLELKKVELPLFTFADKSDGRQVMLNYSGAPYLTLWSDGGPFLCVEPCWGLPDHEAQRPFEKKAGIEEIGPGGTLTRSFTMAPFLPV
jgi:galactose mutarotase-like enzyme